jgi:hypothetical protein
MVFLSILTTLPDNDLIRTKFSTPNKVREGVSCKQGRRSLTDNECDMLRTCILSGTLGVFVPPHDPKKGLLKVARIALGAMAAFPLQEKPKLYKNLGPPIIHRVGGQLSDAGE